MSSVVISGDTSGSITLQAPAVSGTTTLTLPATSGTVLQSGTAVTEAQGGTGTTTGYYGFKNRIINGGMVIDQRNAGASVTPTNGQYLLDRWAADVSQASKFTVIQSSTAPAGFSNSLLVTSSSAYTVGTNDYFALHQFVEGFNTADFSFGTANATYITLSFWVRSSLTGTFGVGLRGASNTRSYTATYTINAANTFEYKTIIIPGDTSGTWLTTNGVGIGLFFSLGVGSANSTTAGSWQSVNATSPTGAGSVVGTNGATWYVTGVQLEKGSTATSFDYRPYGTELALCQRYFCKTYEVTTVPATVTQTGPVYKTLDATQSYASLSWSLPVTMRASPTTVSYAPSSGTSGKFSTNAFGPDSDVASTSANLGTTNIAYIVNAVSIGVSSYVLAHFTASAEL